MIPDRIKTIDTRKEVDPTAVDLEAILSPLFGPGVNSEYRLETFLAIMRRKPAGIFWPAFHETWPCCDDIWHGRRRLLRELSRRSLCEAPGTNYLPDAARGFFDALPDPFIAFRGCSRRRVRGLSWTTNQTVAKRFARGHRFIRVPGPVIAKGLVPKSAVFGVYLERKEAEIVTDPRRIADVEIRPFDQERGGGAAFGEA